MTVVLRHYGNIGKCDMQEALRIAGVDTSGRPFKMYGLTQEQVDILVVHSSEYRGTFSVQISEENEPCLSCGQTCGHNKPNMGGLRCGECEALVED